MAHKYLENIGIKEKDTPLGWNQGDDRESMWLEQREKYGFDERETWSLDYTFRLWFYERLKMYNEINCNDTSFHKFIYKDKTYTLQECIDYILITFEKMFKDNSWDFKEDVMKEVEKAHELIPLILPCLWW